VNTHRLKRPLSALSAATLLAALVAAPVPVRAEPSLGSGGSTATQGANADSAQTPSPDRTDSPAEADAGSEAITDTVLQVGADSTARNLSWMSESAGGGEVRWAPASELVGGKLPADADKAETTDSGLAADLKRHFNHASMTDLKPGIDYAYQVGSEEDGYTEVEQFTTGSAGGDDEFLVFGDPQVGAGGGDPDDAAGWDRTLSSAVATADEPSFFYSLGDQVNSAGNQEQYAQYLAPEATRTIPQATTIGNHDVSSKAYEQHFNRPNVSQDHGGGGVITSGGDYWFIDDGVLFLNINSNSPDVDAHAEFIDEVVAEHGDQARWTVLGFHHSIYSTATHWDDLDVKRLRKAIPPVAARNDIDLVVSGHDHIFNRTFLMDGEGKRVKGSEAGAEEEKEDGQTLYLTLTSSSGSKFYDYVPGLDWEGKSVHNDVPAFTRVRVSDEALRATTYEVPAGGAPADGERAEAQAAAEQIDDVELRRAEAEEPAPDDDPVQTPVPAPARVPTPRQVLMMQVRMMTPTVQERATTLVRVAPPPTAPPPTVLPRVVSGLTVPTTRTEQTRGQQMPALPTPAPRQMQPRQMRPRRTPQERAMIRIHPGPPRRVGMETCPAPAVGSHCPWPSARERWHSVRHFSW